MKAEQGIGTEATSDAQRDSDSGSSPEERDRAL